MLPLRQSNGGENMNNNTEIISHHGILGQKWGIRRYQNADGSLTPAGRKRAQQLKGEYNQLTGKKLKGKIPNENPDKKPVRKLTDTELSDRIRRLQNEKTALNLEKDLSSNGHKFVRSLGRDVLAPAAIDAGRNAATRVFSNWLNKSLGLDKSGLRDEFEELKKSTTVAKLKKEKYQAERDLKRMMADEKEKRAKEKQESLASIKPEVKEQPKERYEQLSFDFGPEFSKTPVNSTALTDYEKSGKDWFDELYRN